MTPRTRAIFLPVLLLLLAALACIPPASTPPFTADDFPPSAYVTDAEAMIRIPAGEFSMGCDPQVDAWCQPEEPPVRSAYVDAYEVDKYEVTQARYARCVAAGACTPPAEVNAEGRTPYYGNPAYDLFPVIHVDWQQAATFCAWEGKRLLTEAEWEKAARGSEDTRPYVWGGEYDRSLYCEYPKYWQPVGYREDDSVYCLNGTSPVGSHPATVSPYGVYDLPGNVQEWVQDWYTTTTDLSAPLHNPSGPPTGEQRSIRGGDYFEMPALQDPTWRERAHLNSLRVSYRSGADPALAGDRQGFRCARTVDEPRMDLRVRVEGPGQVTSTPIGIACGDFCASGFPLSISVTLQAHVGTGARFAGWTGPCLGSSTFCTLKLDTAPMDGSGRAVAVEVTAVFSALADLPTPVADVTKEVLIPPVHSQRSRD